MAWQSTWLRRLLLAAWIPALYFALGLFVYEQWLTRMADSIVHRLGGDESLKPIVVKLLAGEPIEKLPPAQRAMASFALSMIRPHLDELHQEGRKYLEELLPGVPLTMDRHTIWCWLMEIFFRYPQGVVMFLIVGLVAPPLVSNDVASKAFLLYFSRPISCTQYVLGKLCTVWVFLVMISAIPALVLYLFGVLLSPTLGVLEHTWDVPLRILAATVVLMVPTSMLALALSASTSKSWIAGFTWFAIWAFGVIARNVVAMLALSAKDLSLERWSLISLYHTLGNVQGWIFGTETNLSAVLEAGGLLTLITLLSWGVLARRVAAPMRI